MRRATYSINTDNLEVFVNALNDYIKANDFLHGDTIFTKTSEQEIVLKYAWKSLPFSQFPIKCVSDLYDGVGISPYFNRYEVV